MHFFQNTSLKNNLFHEKYVDICFDLLLPTIQLSRFFSEEAGAVMCVTDYVGNTMVNLAMVIVFSGWYFWVWKHIGQNALSSLKWSCENMPLKKSAKNI